MIKPTDFQPAFPKTWKLIWRGPNWNYDNFPMKLVVRPWFTGWNDPRVLYDNAIILP